MEVVFGGLNNARTSDIKMTAQLMPIFYDTTVRGLVAATVTALGEFSTPVDKLVYMISIDSIAALTLDLSKGTSAASAIPLATITSNGDGTFTTTAHKNYVGVLETYVTGTNTVVFMHFSPSLFHLPYTEYFFAESSIAANVTSEALMADGYYNNFVSRVNSDYTKILKCGELTSTVDVGTSYDWINMFNYEGVIWTSWGQTDIDFEYMEQRYPERKFKDFKTY